MATRPDRGARDGAGAEHLVRVGRIEFVNCFPLYRHFAEELGGRGVAASIVQGHPAALNAMLTAGDIDVALPSSIAFARDAGRLALLPQVSISAFGAVDSVQLFTSVPLPQVRRIALTEKSATSICLLKVLCREWGLEPEFAPRVGSLAEVFADFDGVLLIGDEALYVLRAGVYPYHYDLGEEWRTVTSLPMVFAVCAAGRGFVEERPEAAAAVGQALLGSRDRCAADPAGTAAAAALVYDFSQAYLVEYFDKLKFGFTPEYRAGLREFYRRAAAAGELDAVPDLGEVAHAGCVRAVTCGGVTIRPAMPHDWERVMGVMVEWWGGRDLRHLLPRIFFEHFGSTSLVVEHEDELVAFLVGFLCPTHAGEAYIHFIGVHPAWRRSGMARDLYARFERLARAHGCHVVRAVTSPVNSGSIAFHTRIGFELVPGDAEVDGVPVHLGQAWTDDGVVKFERRLAEGTISPEPATGSAALAPEASS